MVNYWRFKHGDIMIVKHYLLVLAILFNTIYNC